jgi:hypothetical protein
MPNDRTPRTAGDWRDALVAIVLWAVAFLVLLTGAGAMLNESSGGSDAPPIARTGNQLRPNNTNARAAGSAVAVANRNEAPLTILAIGASPFRASDYGLASLQTGPVPRGVELALIWVRADAPNHPHEQPIALSASVAGPTALDRNPEWRGDIRFLAVGVKGVADQPLRIDGFRLERLGTMAAVADIVRGWTRFERWDGRSINLVFGGSDTQRAWLPPLAFGASLIAAALVAIRARRRGVRAPVAALATPFIVGWFAVDVRWQANLVAQAQETLSSFAGRSWEARHQQVEDADLFRFAQAALAKMPATPVRVFATSDFEYFRRRAGYHLYPHNVLAYDWAEPNVIRPGDYVFFYQKNDVRYDNGAGELQWDNGRRLKAQPIVARRGAGLFIAGASAP